MENLRSWVNAAGLVLFAPRPQIASPAPSLVEAVLGAPNSNPTLETDRRSAQSARPPDRRRPGRAAESARAQALARFTPARLATPRTSSRLPLSSPTSLPCAAIRPGSSRPRPPAPLKVSQLALATYEALTRRGPLTAFDVATEVGKEVTEAAVLRALAELWTHLRVLPLPQPDGLPTLWELASARFTKQIKAGANAGQPSALSALISLYLGQAVVASEDEIESFLSPLAPRSRIRDVIHALLAARQLDTLAVEGRTVLHVAGELPAFLAPEPAVAASEPEAIEVSGYGSRWRSGRAARRRRYRRSSAAHHQVRSQAAQDWHRLSRQGQAGEVRRQAVLRTRFERGSKPAVRKPDSGRPREGAATQAALRQRRPIQRAAVARIR